MAQVATTMTKKKDDTGEPEFCTYASIKVDDRLIHLAKAAANLEDIPLQELVSDILNEAIAKRLNRTPIKRRPPPTRR